MASDRGAFKLIKPYEGDSWWGFTSWCGGSCSIHTPWWCISIHYPKAWCKKWWFPNLVKLSFASKATVGYKTVQKRYKHANNE
jgi:hypothetical protein